MRYLMTLAIVLILVGTSHAHRVNVYAYAEAGKIYGEAYFVDGTRAKNSEFKVLRQDTGEVVLQGRTDDSGQFSFPIPGPYGLKIILRASMGHENEYLIEKDEVLEALGMKAQETQRTETSSKVDSVPHDTPSQDLEAVLERHLGPLRKELVRLRQAQERPHLRDILGGLGYIMGLVGLYLYMRSRRS